MDSSYHPQAIEAKIQDFYNKNQLFKPCEQSEKDAYYCLSMLPYPSGQLHMGHVRNYTLGDVFSRVKRMQGYEVLQPMGWDAFGLPAENAAIQNNIAPAAWTDSNIATMREQLKRLGYAYDWDREIATCKPDYYRWNQWLFIQLYKKGLAYRKKSVVNWDPVDQTVLANEQVVDGKGWRSGADVERKEIQQWFLKITDYADELLEELPKLTGWPEQVRTMQHHWIGRSEGAEVHFPVIHGVSEPISVFTTRVDTLFGVTFLVVAPQHPLAQKAAEEDADIAAFVKECQHIKVSEADIATMPKKGRITPFNATHPLTGDPIPIWVANYVLMDYGSGAVMAVPAHDQRDFEFAQQYDLPIKPVIAVADKEDWDYSQQALSGLGHCINSGEFDGLASDDAKKSIKEALSKHNLGEATRQYRLRDWGVSRQRYWGTPIPMIHCDDCGAVPVPEEALPVILPEDVAFDGAQSPLQHMPEFLNVPCPSCDKPAKRETDTFDTFIDSSWYFVRYTCADQHDQIVDERAKHWLPVDQYIGGIEHATMHLLYARFIYKAMRDLDLVAGDEPFMNLLTQGMVLMDGSKMSKSKGNIVAPMPLIEQYGADTVRLFICFAAPPELDLEWNDRGVEGSYRFLKRLWQLAYTHHEGLTTYAQAKTQPNWDELSPEQQKIRARIHQDLKKANDDMQRQQLNTVVSAGMKILNALQDLPALDDGFDPVLGEGMEVLLRLLAPITPHICEELYQNLGFGSCVMDAQWPQADERALHTQEVTLIIQVNGKKRADITVAHDASEETIKAQALALDSVQKHLQAPEPRKIIVVPGRLVNIVG